MTSREFRGMFSLTLFSVAAETGFSPSAISKWERECDSMPQEYVNKVKEVYGVEIEKQWKNTVAKGVYNKTIVDYDKKISKLQERIRELEMQNAKLQYKLKQISTIAGE